MHMPGDAGHDESTAGILPEQGGWSAPVLFKRQARCRAGRASGFEHFDHVVKARHSDQALAEESGAQLKQIS